MTSSSSAENDDDDDGAVGVRWRAATLTTNRPGEKNAEQQQLTGAADDERSILRAAQRRRGTRHAGRGAAACPLLSVASRHSSIGHSQHRRGGGDNTPLPTAESDSGDLLISGVAVGGASRRAILPAGIGAPQNARLRRCSPRSRESAASPRPPSQRVTLPGPPGVAPIAPVTSNDDEPWPEGFGSLFTGACGGATSRGASGGIFACRRQNGARSSGV